MKDILTLVLSSAAVFFVTESFLSPDAVKNPQTKANLRLLQAILGGLSIGLLDVLEERAKCKEMSEHLTDTGLTCSDTSASLLILP